MSFLRTTLSYERVSGATAGTEMLQITSHNSLFVFNDLIDTIKKECGALIEKEAGGAMHEEWLISLSSQRRLINASWNWYGITFSTQDDLGLKFLKDIEEILKKHQYWKLQLFITSKFG